MSKPPEHVTPTICVVVPAGDSPMQDLSCCPSRQNGGKACVTWWDILDIRQTEKHNVQDIFLPPLVNLIYSERRFQESRIQEQVSLNLLIRIMSSTKVVSSYSPAWGAWPCSRNPSRWPSALDWHWLRLRRTRKTTPEVGSTSRSETELYVKDHIYKDST